MVDTIDMLMCTRRGPRTSRVVTRQAYMEPFTVAPQGVLVREAWLEEEHLSRRQGTREELAERPDKRQRA